MNKESKIKTKKKRKYIFLILIIILIGVACFFVKSTGYQTIKKEEYSAQIKEENGKKYVLISIYEDTCGETIKYKKQKKTMNGLKLYFNVTRTCGLCAPGKETFKIPVANNIDLEQVKIYYKVKQTHCDSDVAYKPILYIYPKQEMDLTIKLGYSNLLTHTYPKYKNEWRVHVSENGNIYDYKTKRNYYALYWEALDSSKNNMEEGFVVKGKDTVSFLEEKLEYLGLNEKERNEFIIYWIDKLENNKYNYIRFRTTKEVNEYMPLSFSEEPDSLIRIIMDFKPLNKKIKVKEQKLVSNERKGFTVVEWGGRKLNN